MTSDPHRGQPVLSAGSPLIAGATAAILVHGRNAGPASILTLIPRLRRPAISYLAPSAADHTWYPYTFLSPIERNEPFLTSALDALQALCEDLQTAGIPRDRTVFIGFSQGACLSLEFVVRHPARWGGVVALSGGLIGPPGTRWDATGAFAGTPVFLGCSDVDAHIPNDRVEETAAAFARGGADVVMQIYPGMGHTVNDDEIGHARVILDHASAAQTPDSNPGR